MESTAPVWKKIYQTISINTNKIAFNVIEDVLELCKHKLINVLLEYKCYTPESFHKWVKESKHFAGPKDEAMRTFMNRLSIELDLDVTDAWTVLCNYLVFEYYGKVDELKSIITFESNVKCLIDSIWYFYTAERMFLLKTMRHIFEKVTNKKHLFHKEYKKFLESLDMAQLWVNLVQVYDNLFFEIDKEKVRNNPNNNLERWVHRNNREQCEVVLLLTHTLHYYKITGREYSELLLKFARHNYGRSPLYDHHKDLSKKKDIQEITYAEMGCMLVLGSLSWDLTENFVGLTRNSERILEVDVLHRDHSLMLFVWMLLKSKHQSDSLDYCNQVLTVVLNNRIFLFLQEVMESKIFNCFVGFLVYKAVYKFMLEFCKMVENDLLVFEQEGVPTVLALLMKYPALGAKDGLTNLILIALEVFPASSKPLFSIGKELLKHEKSYNQVILWVENMDTLLLDIPWSYPEVDQLHLPMEIKLYAESDKLVVPKFNLVQKFQFKGQDLVRYHFSYALYDFLEYYILALLKRSHIDRSMVDYLCSGYELIIAIIQNYRGDYSKDTKLQHCISRLNFVVAHFSEGTNRCFDMVKIYFRVKLALVLRKLGTIDGAFAPPIQKKFLPSLTSTDFTFRQLFTGEVKIEGIFYTFLKQEEKMDDHTLLLEYMTFILFVLENNIHRELIVKPGLAYLTYTFFPQFVQWRYKDPHQKVLLSKTYYTILTRLFEKHPDDNPEVDKTMFYKYLETCLNEEWFVVCFVAYFVKEKYYLQKLMGEESNWVSGPVCDVIENFKKQLVILILLMKYKQKLCPGKVCSIDRKVGSLTRGITSHMVTAYNSALAILSLRFLDVLAHDENAPIMALLGLDYDQIQQIFLERLRDPMEDEGVKIQILDLIATCVLYQHGMTAAFFNLQWSRKWYDALRHKILYCDTVTDFMVDYLQNIRKSREYLKNPLQVGILKVMCNLWLCKKQSLIQDVLKLKSFWPLLLNPLLQPFDLRPGVYAYLLKIVNLQMFTRPADEYKYFTETLEKLLSNKEQMKKFNDYLLAQFRSLGSNIGMAPDVKNLLTTYNQFIVIGAQKRPELFTNTELRHLIITYSVRGIQLELPYYDMVGQWLDLCFTSFSNWDIDYTRKEKKIHKDFLSVFTIISQIYGNLRTRVRDVVLSIFHRVITYLRKYYEERTWLVLEMLECFGIMLDHEYKELERIPWDDIDENPYENKERLIPWMLCITIINDILKMERVADFLVWFKYREYLPRLADSIPKLLNCVPTLRLARLAIYSFTLYLQTSMSFDFTAIDIVRFYDTIETPLRKAICLTSLKTHPMKLKEVYITLTILMQFNQRYLNRVFKDSVITDSCGFIGLNEVIINYILSIPEYTVDINGLDLLLNTLSYIDDVLLLGNNLWILKASDVYNNTVNGIKKTINACISTILRPKNITFLTVDVQGRVIETDVSTEVLAIAMNRLIRIIILGLSCLSKIKPGLTEIFSIQEPVEIDEILVDTDFNVPNFNMPITSELTYGRLLCLGNFLCKTLMQLREHVKEPNKVEEMKEEDAARYIGFVQHQNPSENLTQQKLSAFLRYAISEYSGLSDPWITQLNLVNIKFALDLLIYFLAGQMYLTVKTFGDNLIIAKKNLASELQFLHEYCKKRAMELPTPKTELFQSETDVIRKLQLTLKHEGLKDNATDDHFLIYITQWFLNVCSSN